MVAHDLGADGWVWAGGGGTGRGLCALFAENPNSNEMSPATISLTHHKPWRCSRLTEFSRVVYTLISSDGRELLDVKVKVDLMVRHQAHQSRHIAPAIHERPVLSAGQRHVGRKCRCLLVQIVREWTLSETEPSGHSSADSDPLDERTRGRGRWTNVWANE